MIPNNAISRRIKGAGLILFSYTQRINRPDLGYLNPYVDIIDSWNISYGNPHLRPAVAHVLNLAYNTFVKRSSFNLAIFHQFTNNAIQQITMLGTDTISRTTFSNIGKVRNTNFTLSVNTTFIKNLNLSLNGNAGYSKYIHIISGKPFRNEGFSFGISGTLTYRVKNWRMSTNANYHAPSLMLQGRSAGYLATSLSLNRQFLKNAKATVGLAVANPFHRHRHLVTIVDDPAFYLARKSYTVVRRFTVTLYYRFGRIRGSGGSN